MSNANGKNGNGHQRGNVIALQGNGRVQDIHAFVDECIADGATGVMAIAVFPPGSEVGFDIQMSGHGSKPVLFFAMEWTKKKILEEYDEEFDDDGE